MDKLKQINVCPKDHPVTPLIFTFAFNYNEYWCPGCGYLTGMFGHMREMSTSIELIAMHDDLKEKAEPFLQYQSSLRGAKVKDDNGNLVPLVAEKVEGEYLLGESND